MGGSVLSIKYRRTVPKRTRLGTAQQTWSAVVALPTLRADRIAALRAAFT